MAGKKFTPLMGAGQEAAAAERDFGDLERFGPVALGREHLFWLRPLSVQYLPLSRLAWAYLRGEGGSATICCGRASFSDHYLVLWDRDGGSVKIPLDHEQTVRSILAALSQRCPGAAIGYSDERARAFAPGPLST